MAVVILALLFSSLCFAAKETQRVSWPQLAQAAQDEKVAITLPSGTKIRGTVLSVEPQTLVVDVTKTSNSGEVPKGKASIPRASVSRIEATHCSTKWRTLLTIGIPGGALAATAAAINAQSPPVEGGEAFGVGLAVAAAGAVGGYFLGKKLDCHVTDITVEQ